MWKAVTLLLLAGVIKNGFGFLDDEKQATTTIKLPTATELANCSDTPYEVVFVLDSSGSVGQQNFTVMKNFVNTVIDQLNIGDVKTHVGIITFNSYPVLRIRLTDYLDATSLKKAVDSIPYNAGITETNNALDMLNNEGYNGARQGVAKVAIVLTDGNSFHPNATAASALKAQNNGITMFAIGIGTEINLPELSNIASNPDVEHIFRVTTFSALQNIVRTLTTRTCRVKYIQQSTVSPPVITTPTYIDTYKNASEACNETVADILFILDASGSLTEPNFNIVKQFVINIINTLDIGENLTQVGVITFSNYPRLDIKLGQYQNKLDLINAVNILKYYPGITATDKALDMARIEGFIGARPDAPNIAIVVTDGHSTSPELTKPSAQLLKQSGATVFGIGVGLEIDKDELNLISSNPDSEFVFFVSNFTELKRIESLVSKNTCEVPSQVSLTTTPPPCVAKVADVVFVIDSSGSVGSANFEIIKTFIKQMIDVFDVSPDYTRIGVITYNNKATTQFGLNVHNSSDSVKAAVDNIMFTSGGTDTGLALESLRLTGFNNERPGVPNIAIVVTDGLSTDPIATNVQAKLLKNEGDVLIAIGVGKETNQKELKGIASVDKTTGNDLVYQVGSYEALQTLNKIVARVTCAAEKVTGVTQAPTLPASTTEYCVDTISNCEDYGPSVCSDYKPWAEARCRATCKFCDGGPTTPAPECKNLIPNCHEYGTYICTTVSVIKWTKHNCPLYCNFCSPFNATSTAATTPQATTVSSIATEAPPSVTQSSTRAQTTQPTQSPPTPSSTVPTTSQSPKTPGTETPSTKATESPPTPVTSEKTVTQSSSPAILTGSPSTPATETPAPQTVKVSQSTETEKPVTLPGTPSTVGTETPVTVSTKTPMPNTGTPSTLGTETPSPGSTESPLPKTGTPITLTPETSKSVTSAAPLPDTGSPSTLSKGTAEPSPGTGSPSTPRKQTPEPVTTASPSPDTGSPSTPGKQTPEPVTTASPSPDTGSPSTPGKQTPEPVTTASPSPGTGSPSTLGNQTPEPVTTASPSPGTGEPSTPGKQTPEPVTTASPSPGTGSPSTPGKQTPEPVATASPSLETGSPSTPGIQTPEPGTTASPSPDTGSPSTPGKQTPEPVTTESPLPGTGSPSTPGIKTSEPTPSPGTTTTENVGTKSSTPDQTIIITQSPIIIKTPSTLGTETSSTQTPSPNTGTPIITKLLEQVTTETPSPGTGSPTTLGSSTTVPQTVIITVQPPLSTKTSTEPPVSATEPRVTNTPGMSSSAQPQTVIVTNTFVPPLKNSTIASPPMQPVSSSIGTNPQIITDASAIPATETLQPVTTKSTVTPATAASAIPQTASPKTSQQTSTVLPQTKSTPIPQNPSSTKIETSTLAQTVIITQPLLTTKIQKPTNGTSGTVKPVTNPSTMTPATKQTELTETSASETPATKPSAPSTISKQTESLVTKSSTGTSALPQTVTHVKETEPTQPPKTVSIVETKPTTPPQTVIITVIPPILNGTKATTQTATVTGTRGSTMSEKPETQTPPQSSSPINVTPTQTPKQPSTGSSEAPSSPRTTQSTEKPNTEKSPAPQTEVTVKQTPSLTPTPELTETPPPLTNVGTASKVPITSAPSSQPTPSSRITSETTGGVKTSSPASPPSPASSTSAILTPSKPQTVPPVSTGVPPETSVPSSTGKPETPTTLSSQQHMQKSLLLKNQVSESGYRDQQQLCAAKVADLFFVIDSSGSVGQANFEYVKSFINQAITTFDVGTDSMRIGLITYNYKAMMQFGLKAYNNSVNLTNAIKAVQFTSGGTDTGAALETLRRDGFTNDRPGVPNIAIVITDGLSSDPLGTQVQARLAKESGNTLIAIGVGNSTDQKELSAVASVDPNTGKQLIFEVNSYGALQSVEQAVINLACKVAGQTNPTVSPMPTTVALSSQQTQSQCTDTVSNCAEYGRGVCSDYKPWANAHCKKYCEFCIVPGEPSTTPTPCVDTIDNCKEYGTYICTSINLLSWTKKNCLKYCGLCGDNTPPTNPPTTKATTPEPVCKNKISNCNEYGGKKMCSDPTYASWAQDHCREYCGFCSNYEVLKGTVLPNNTTCPDWRLPEGCTLVQTDPNCCPLPKCPEGYVLTAKAPNEQ